MVSSARNKSCSIAFELGTRVQGHPQLGIMFILLAEHKLTLLGMRGPNGCTWRFYVREQRWVRFLASLFSSQPAETCALSSGLDTHWQPKGQDPHEHLEDENVPTRKECGGGPQSS